MHAIADIPGPRDTLLHINKAIVFFYNVNLKTPPRQKGGKKAVAGADIAYPAFFRQGAQDQPRPLIGEIPDRIGQE